MHGFDQFAILVDGKVVAEGRGGMFMIALRLHVKTKEVLDREARIAYQDELNRYNSEERKCFTAYESLRAYSDKAEGDCLFFSTENELSLVKDGKLTNLEEILSIV